MIVTDPQQGDNPIIFANPAAAALTGYAIGELVGQNYRMLFGPGTDPTMIDRPVEAPSGLTYPSGLPGSAWPDRGGHKA